MTCPLGLKGSWLENWEWEGAKRSLFDLCDPIWGVAGKEERETDN